MSHDLAWQRESLCRTGGYDPELWWRSGDTKLARAVQRQAIRVCRECPVQLSCLNYALTNGESEGVWGAMTERQRDALCPNSKRGPGRRRSTLAAAG